MPKYRYIYFNARGRGEIVRLIFAAAGVQYEDKRIEFSEWPNLKPEMPLGMLPVLEIDGKKYPESISITRYLAREFGLDGRNNIEKLKADVVVDQVAQLREDFIAVHFEKDEAQKAEKARKLKDETMPKLFGYIEKMLSENSGGNGFLVGNQLTWADIVLASFADMLSRIPDALSKYTKIAAHQQLVEGLPKIAAYISKRPKTDF